MRKNDSTEFVPLNDHAELAWRGLAPTTHFLTTKKHEILYMVVALKHELPPAKGEPDTAILSPIKNAKRIALD